MSPSLLVAAFACLSAAGPAFPLKVSANGRYLIDAAGAPFIVHAGTSWMAEFNPCHGKSSAIELPAVAGRHRFDPPTSGAEDDWVLLVRDAAKPFEPR